MKLLLVLVLSSFLAIGGRKFLGRRDLNIISNNERRELVSVSRVRIMKSRILFYRGGATKKQSKDKAKSKQLKDLIKEKEKEEEEEEEDDEDEDDDDNEGFSMSTRQIPLSNMASSIWVKTPPISKLFVFSSMAITVLSFVLNNNKWPDFLHFNWKAIIPGFQLWRLFTAFLFYGQLDMFYPLTMQFVWQHMTQLEKLNYNEPEEFLVMIIFGAVSLITVYSLVGISMKFLGHNLATYLVYIWSRVFEGADVNFMDILTLKSELLPWFFCAQTFLLEREIPFADLIGIAVGHLYYYLKQKKVLAAPKQLKDWFDTPDMKKKYEKFRGDFE